MTESEFNLKKTNLVLRMINDLANASDLSSLVESYEKIAACEDISQEVKNIIYTVISNMQTIEELIQESEDLV